MRGQVERACKLNFNKSLLKEWIQQLVQTLHFDWSRWVCDLRIDTQMSRSLRTESKKKKEKKEAKHSICQCMCTWITQVEDVKT